MVVEANAVNFYFSHDEEAFDAEELIANAEITVTYTYEDGSTTTENVAVDYSLFSFAAENPAELYADVNEAYAAVEMAISYNGEDTGAIVTVYIGVKGDATLDGIADANDAAAVLIYSAAKNAGNEAYVYSAEDEVLEQLAFFLADTDTESQTYGADGEVVDANDAANILVFAADRGANPDKTIAKAWEDVLNPETAA